jgi:vacuolar-type H+-ATPase subunit H
MLYAVIGLIVLASIGLALYALIDKCELVAQIAALQREIQEQDASNTAEIEGLRAESAKLDKIKHIPNIIVRSNKLEGEIAAKLERARKEADEIGLIAHKEAERIKARNEARVDEAQQRALEIVRSATQEANSLKQKIISDTENDAAKAKEARRIAEWQANNVIEDAQKKAKEIASQARKEAKEKIQKVDDTLLKTTAYALEVRERAEARAQEIGGKAYEALKRHEFYEAAAKAMQNVVSGYGGTYMVPASHVLDELAEDYGFHKAGERLKIARERTRIMEKSGAAATCNYPEGWKREYAINFVLGAFNGKVDSILARLKPANQGKLVQEIRDVYTLANHNGEVFKNARIHEEYLDARLEELKWAVAVQRLKEKEREEQRAIREQIREEEKARKDYDRAIKQAEREEETLTKAIERARLEYAAANAEDRVKYEAKLRALEEKLREAEENNQRAICMAQQTKCGHVYVISNVGSFGENVYKIGLTRRLEPLDRVKELGDASVPFAFDVHAMIYSQDAPALETALHRRFLQDQVNKVNRRKEFFRLTLQDIRSVIDEMKQEVKWTIAAEAKDYRETLAMERQMQEDPEFRRRWAQSEAAYESRLPLDEEGDETVQEDEDIALTVNTQLAGDLGAAIPQVD